jgi:hypothetical protein
VLICEAFRGSGSRAGDAHRVRFLWPCERERSEERCGRWCGDAERSEESRCLECRWVSWCDVIVFGGDECDVQEAEPKRQLEFILAGDVSATDSNQEDNSRVVIDLNSSSIPFITAAFIVVLHALTMPVFIDRRVRVSAWDRQQRRSLHGGWAICSHKMTWTAYALTIPILLPLLWYLLAILTLPDPY